MMPRRIFAAACALRSFSSTTASSSSSSSVVRTEHVWDLDTGAQSSPASMLRSQHQNPQLYEWAKANKISVTSSGPKSYALNIGSCSMPVFGSEPPTLSAKEWAVLSLPTNKRVLYKTLKGFVLDQNVLYVGETGSGKTWLARAMASLLGLRLWTVSLTEYTKNEDLTVRTTFGEEGDNKTGLSKCSVLQWMEEGGVLLLDELHKPMDGLAVLNNILQYGEFTLPNGRALKMDSQRCKVIATMNPIRPPYRGELPSAELAARFGTTLEVRWLPIPEEIALLRQHAPDVSPALIERLVWMGTSIRSQYPHSIPIPLSTRTMMHIVSHCNKFQSDSIRDIIETSFNPCAAIDDVSVREALDKVLTANGFEDNVTTATFEQSLTGGGGGGRQRR